MVLFVDLIMLEEVMYLIVQIINHLVIIHIKLEVK